MHSSDNLQSRFSEIPQTVLLQLFAAKSAWDFFAKTFYFICGNGIF